MRAAGIDLTEDRVTMEINEDGSASEAMIVSKAGKVARKEARRRRKMGLPPIDISMTDTLKTTQDAIIENPLKNGQPDSE